MDHVCVVIVTLFFDPWLQAKVTKLAADAHI